MKTIWKYRLDDKENVVELPQGAQVLSAGAQGNQIYIWALIDEAFASGDAPRDKRTFEVLGTGWEGVDLSPCAAFIGTVQMPNTIVGTLVFHVFETTQAEAK